MQRLNTIQKMRLFAEAIRKEGMSFDPVITFDAREVERVEESAGRIAVDISGVYQFSTLYFRGGGSARVYGHVADQIFAIKQRVEDEFWAHAAQVEGNADASITG